jgi:hypothetical protein
MYAPGMGRFLTRDTWSGNYSEPLSFNRWNYVEGNPISYIDPLGHWEILPGFELSDGGLYGQGQLTMPLRTLCKDTCLTSSSATTTISIFSPKVENGNLYNELAYIKDEHVYSAVEGTFRCMDGAIPWYIWSNDWYTTLEIPGKSYSFSNGAFYDIASGVAFGEGYDGPVPFDVSLSDSMDASWAISLNLWKSQPFEERELVDFVKIFEDADNSSETQRIKGIIGAVSFAAQAFSGVQALNSRNIDIIIQENRIVPGLSRAIIETLQVWKVGDLKSAFFWNFVSYKNGIRREDNFHMESKLLWKR